MRACAFTITIDDKESSPEIVKFLWLCKIKSRDCFLMILEFTTPKSNNYDMPILGTFLHMINPLGWEFFCQYVKMKSQFID